MKKIFTSSIFILLAFFSNWQSYGQISAGPKISQTCPGQTLNLSVGVAVGLGSNVSTDDYFSAVQNIGFSFNYFGQNYTQFVVSGNNTVSFDLSLANQWCEFVYSLALGAGELDKAILYPFQDAYPSNGNQISVITFGNPGRRVCVIQACQVPLYSCTNLLSSSQVVLYEGSNIIDINILNKPAGCTWQQGTGIIGIRNNTTEILAPGRNLPNVNWSEQRKTYRFIPNATGSYSLDTLVYRGQQVITFPDYNNVTWYAQGDTVNAIARGQYANVIADADVNYYVAKYTGGGLCNDTAVVTFYDTCFVQFKNFKGSADVEICAGDVYQFFGRTLTQTGKYTEAIISHEGCDSIFEINLLVNPLPEVVLNSTGTIEICEGLSKKIANTSYKQGETFQWYRDGNAIAGETKYDIEIFEGGTYHLEVTSGKGCVTLSNNVRVIMRPTPVAQMESIGDGTVSCTYDTVYLVAKYYPDHEYYWWPETALRSYNEVLYGNVVRGIFRESETNMSVTVKNQYGCVSSTDFKVFSKPCCDVHVPNAFSPNGDGLNDKFAPILKPLQNVILFSVYDRNGALVYESATNSEGWNGTYKNGKDAEAGVYMYHIIYTCDDGKNYSKKEAVTLLR